MFNLIKDDFDENVDDIINSINKILDKKEEEEKEGKDIDKEKRK